VPDLVLRRGRENSVLRRHPWIFSGAVQRVNGNPASGESVRVLDSNGHILGCAAWSPTSQIRARMWSFGADIPIDRAFLQQRIDAAQERRATIVDAAETNAYRLISSEADGLPGLIVDRYDFVLVCQFLSAGAEYWREHILDILQERYPAALLYERSDTDAREKEGLPPRSGACRTAEPTGTILIKENGLHFHVDVRNGHKTGFYLDQRDNRALFRNRCGDAEVLNCFSYTGGFAVAALAGGARQVTDVDVSTEALLQAGENVRRNGFDTARYMQQEGDVFHFLRGCRDSRRQFDVIVLDPPKFAASASQIERAARGYKDINLLALKLLQPGGLLFTFSCSGHMTELLFRKVVADAALDAGREVRVLSLMTQAADHPVALHIPESWYLKGLLCRVD
jgi:23S rRNA (cytosine1962-C5)-methyltransferase